MSSSRPGAGEAADILAASPLPIVIWKSFLADAGGAVGWNWWERGDAEEGGVPLTAG